MRVVVRWSPPIAPTPTERWLTDAERERLGRLQRAGDRSAFLSAHVLVREVAAEVMGVRPDSVRLEQRCPTCGGAHGPPTLALAGAPRISFAHTDGLVIAAAATAAVGVDAERLGAADVATAEVALTPVEQLQLAALAVSEQPAALTRWWVRKEAVLKALELGLRVELASLELTPPALPPSVLRLPDTVDPVSLQMFDLDPEGSHVGAVAVASADPVTLDAGPFLGWA